MSDFTDHLDHEISPPRASYSVGQGCLALIGLATLTLATLAGIVGGIWYLAKRAFSG
jgi:hypothetical protein